jgi:hypothetical protein
MVIIVACGEGKCRTKNPGLRVLLTPVLRYPEEPDAFEA